MRFVLRREAEEELIAAAEYYESHRSGLGVAFLEETERPFNALVQFPAQWRIVRAGVRRGLLLRFPYAFHYWEKIHGEELKSYPSVTPRGTRFIGLRDTRRKLSHFY